MILKSYLRHQILQNFFMNARLLYRLVTTLANQRLSYILRVRMMSLINRLICRRLSTFIQAQQALKLYLRKTTLQSLYCRYQTLLRLLQLCNASQSIRRTLQLIIQLCYTGQSGNSTYGQVKLASRVLQIGGLLALEALRMVLSQLLFVR